MKCMIASPRVTASQVPLGGRCSTTGQRRYQRVNAPASAIKDPSGTGRIPFVDDQGVLAFFEADDVMHTIPVFVKLRDVKGGGVFSFVDSSGVMSAPLLCLDEIREGPETGQRCRVAACLHDGKVQYLALDADVCIIEDGVYSNAASRASR